MVDRSEHCDASLAMQWNIYYQRDGRMGIRAAATRAIAIDNACALLDDGADVNEIVEDGAYTGMKAAQIRLYHAARTMKKSI
jgi:hypothetical protein